MNTSNIGCPSVIFFLLLRGDSVDWARRIRHCTQPPSSPQAEAILDLGFLMSSSTALCALSQSLGISEIYRKQEAPCLNSVWEEAGASTFHLICQQEQLFFFIFHFSFIFLREYAHTRVWLHVCVHMHMYMGILCGSRRIVPSAISWESFKFVF